MSGPLHASLTLSSLNEGFKDSLENQHSYLTIGEQRYLLIMPESLQQAVDQIDAVSQDLEALSEKSEEEIEGPHCPECQATDGFTAFQTELQFKHEGDRLVAVVQAKECKACEHRFSEPEALDQAQQAAIERFEKLKRSVGMS